MTEAKIIGIEEVYADYPRTKKVFENFLTKATKAAQVGDIISVDDLTSRFIDACEKIQRKGKKGSER